MTQVINGDVFRLQHDVQVIRAFAREIIHQRKGAIDKQQQQQEQQEDEGSMEEQQKRSQEGHGQQEQQETHSLHTTELNSSSVCAGETGPSTAAAFGPGADANESLGGSDLLSLFMAATTPDGCPMSEDQLVDTVFNFIIAGRDTTAQVGKGRGKREQEGLCGA